MLEMKDTQIFKIPEKFVLHKINKEMCWIFDIKDGDYFELNSTSYFILSCFNGEKPLSEIREQLISEYTEADPKEVCNDLEELLKKMVKEGILESVKRRKGQ